ncbi:hypothetical protein ABIE49_002155 [Bradyrhizobium sp. OAE829]|jgi:hypothetical protein
MFTIIRALVIAVCAYAGSSVAGSQFPDLPNSHQIYTE